ncbi:MAG: hypothetical protein R3C61_08970 [Bacteroidia bacterium]
MNKKLALYFDDFCVIGAVEPFEGKFARVEKNGKDRFSLFFYLDGGRVNYGHAYQLDAERGDEKAIGDFYERICTGGSFDFSGYKRKYVELLDTILNDIRESYHKAFSGLSGAVGEMDISDSIPVCVGFSPNIPKEAHELILQYLEERSFTCDPSSKGTTFSRLILLHKLTRRELKVPGVYGVVEGINDDLNVDLVQVKPDHSLQVIEHQTFPGFGTDPRVGVIARFVVDKADESLHVLHAQAEKESEYRKKTRQAIEWNEQLLRSRRPFISVKLTLSPAPNSELNVSLIQKEIDDLTMVRSQQVTRYTEYTITPHLAMVDLNGIIIFGDSLKNSQVLEGFYRFGKEKLVVYGDEQIFDILKGLLAEPVKAPVSQSGNTIATAGKNPTPTPSAGPQTFSLQSVRAVDLKSGDRVEFTWEPGRLVIAEYQGNGNFKIVYHENSSIVTGDTFVADKFTVGEPAYLKNVVRPSGGVLGNYKSGQVKTLNRITS